MVLVAQCFDMLHHLGHKLSRDIKTVEHKTEHAMMKLRHGDSGPSSPAHGRDKGSGALRESQVRSTTPSSSEYPFFLRNPGMHLDHTLIWTKLHLHDLAHDPQDPHST